MNHPFFRVEDKSEKIGNRSTVYSEGAKQANSTLKYLNQSCNPQKMAQIQKFIDRQLLKEAKNDIYPSFCIPKNVQKLGLGVPIQIHQYKEVKGLSPQHGNRLMLTKIPDNRTQITFTNPLSLNSIRPVDPDGKSQMKSGIQNLKARNKKQASLYYKAQEA